MSSEILYIVGVLCVCGGVVIGYFENKDSGKVSRAEIQAIDDRQDREIEGVKNQVANLRVTIVAQDERIRECKQSFMDIKDDGDYLQDHMSKMREDVTRLDRELSRKRPVVKFQGPFPVEIMKSNGRGVKALIPDKKK